MPPFSPQTRAGTTQPPASPADRRNRTADPHRVGARLSGRTLDIARTRGAVGGVRGCSDPARRGLEAFAHRAVARVTENFR
ncbi:MAG: hypothetical protein DI562_11615 [Stenotrophomonas acidaminiphila]|jgi:hypothetical protein|nr:MAG: hypothetical protein DI562_11615 [Stenotrophomonas acidaminiphila]